MSNFNSSSNGNSIGNKNATGNGKSSIINISKNGKL